MGRRVWQAVAKARGHFSRSFDKQRMLVGAQLGRAVRTVLRLSG